MTSQDLRCPQCSAHVSPGADWCTLCFADLRVPPVAEAAPEVEVAAEVEPDVGPAAVPALVSQQADEQVGGRGKHARSAAHAATSYDEATSYRAATPRDEAEAAALDARANEMLAILAAESSNPLGPLATRLESTSSRVVACVVGLVALVLVGLLVMTVLGHFV
jgi:hypothetical protein